MMQKHKQFRHGAGVPAHGDSPSLWRRMLGLFCVVLVAVASSAQAVHTHGELLPRAEKQVKSPAQAAPVPLSDANCLLCMAMHSALPAVPAVAVAATELRGVLVVGAATDRVPESSPHFAMFSRPPPAVTTTL